MKTKKIIPYIILVCLFILIFIPKIIRIYENCLEKTEKIEEKYQKNDKNLPKIEQKPQEIEKKWLKYRLTSFYPAETSNCTGSGKCTNKFEVNEHGWYTYEGKIVLAAATTYLKKSYGEKDGRHYFKYYDEVQIIIDGTQYDGIILDSCGACMYIDYEERIDLFVDSKNNVIDRGYKGRNQVEVSFNEKDV